MQVFYILVYDYYTAHTLVLVYELGRTSSPRASWHACSWYDLVLVCLTVVRAYGASRLREMVHRIDTNGNNEIDQNEASRTL